VHAPSLCTPREAPPLPAGAWTGCGSGFKAHGAALAERYAGRLSAVAPDVLPHARHIARLAASEFQAGRAVPAEQALPVYLRDKVASRTDERAT
jgi:tRNA threonylcarbamoyladenosine biosynthesis protein TsaB